MNSSVVLYQPQKIFSRWPERENTKVYLHPYSHSLCNSGHVKDPHFPTTVFSCSQGTVRNVIRSGSVFLPRCWDSGSLAFSMQSSIVFSCYWPGIKSSFACPFVPTMFVCSPGLTGDLASPVAYLHFLLLLLLSCFSRDPVRPHRRQPTRLPCPWDSPGKNTGVGCHFLLQCMKVKSEKEVTQSCPTRCDPMETAAYQAPLSMGFSRQEYWSGVPSFQMCLKYSCPLVGGGDGGQVLSELPLGPTPWLTESLDAEVLYIKWHNIFI